MKRAALLLLLAVVSLRGSPARAEPWFAQREGFRCSKCHVNGTGGGMRTAFGRQWAVTHLSLISVGARPDEAPGPDGEARPAPGGGPVLGWVIDPTLNDAIAVGANLRVSHQTVLGDGTPRNTFGNPEANLYLALDALPFLTAYADVSVAEGNVEAREAFLMLHRLEGFRLKAGVLLLPYGLRVWGDEAFIRQQTGFTYATPDLGIEVGYERDGLGAFVALSNGSGGGLDADSDKKLSGTVEYAGAWWRLGASLAYDQNDRRRDLFAGGHAGLTLGRLTLLGEVDLLTSDFRKEDRSIQGLAAYGEANFLLLRGLSLKVVYGYHDPWLDVPEDQRVHLRGGVEVFVVPMLAFTAFYDLRESVPQDRVGNADVVAAEIHVYL